VEACPDRDGREPRPAAGPGAQVLVFDALAGVEGIQARPFPGLQLEQLQHAHRLRRRGHQAQVTAQ
jgi:hypothetical protein